MFGLPNQELQDSSHCMIRDCGPYTSRGSGKGALLEESRLILKHYSPMMDHLDLRMQIVDGGIIHKKARATRVTIWEKIYFRYLKDFPPWIPESISKECKNDVSSAEFKSLMYLYYVLRDRLTYDFIIHFIVPRWKTKELSVDRAEVLHWMSILSQQYEELRTWTDSTRIKVASNLLSTLKQFGLMSGNQRKWIQPIAITTETAYHLLMNLWGEGVRGGNIIEHQDWLMFLLSKSDIVRQLSNLSNLGWIDFEMAGRTVILNIKRIPNIQ